MLYVDGIYLLTESRLKASFMKFDARIAGNNCRETKKKRGRPSRMTPIALRREVLSTYHRPPVSQL